MKSPNGQVVAVGMSGGLDSTMAALLLKEQGFTVVGLTMKIWDDSFRCDAVRSGCYGPGEASDIADAREAADRLGIEHHIVDLCSEYKQSVVEYFRNTYLRGKTPNPCVVCNSRIKFGALLDKALASGIRFDLFATGHYARVAYDCSIDQYLLKRGIDETKDQSYFLYRLSRECLEKVLFPLGDYRKEDIRGMARKAGFGKYAEKKESQDFLEWDDYGTLMQNKGQLGKILDVAGNVIGTHRGIAFYTIGQRRMLNLSGMKEPYYVLDINPIANEIVAGPQKHLFNNALIATDLQWIMPFDRFGSAAITAKIRSTALPTSCGGIDFLEGGAVRVRFRLSQKSITPGQSIVFYADDVVIGGGIIDSVPKQESS